MILLIVKRNLFLTGYCISYRMCSAIVFLKRVCCPEKICIKPYELWRDDTAKNFWTWNVCNYYKVFIVWFLNMWTWRLFLDLNIFPQWLQGCDTPSMWISACLLIRYGVLAFFPHTVHVQTPLTFWIIKLIFSSSSMLSSPL